MNGTASSNTHMTFGVGADARLTVNSAEGQVRVRGADVNEIHVYVRDYDPEDYDWNDPLIVSVNESDVRIATNQGAGVEDLDLDITVPHRCTVSLTTQDAEIKAQDIHGLVTISSGDGEVEVRDIHGNTTVGTTGGDVTLMRVHGDCRVTATDGDVNAHDMAGRLNIHAANGEVSVRESRLNSAVIEASNGEIAVRTSLCSGESYRFHAANGDINLSLAGGSGASVRMHTAEGDIRSKVEAHDVKRDKRSWVGTLGDGSASIVMESSNGDLTLSGGVDHPGVHVEHGNHAGHPTPPTPATLPTPPTPFSDFSTPIPPVPPVPPVAPVPPVPAIDAALGAGDEPAATGKHEDTVSILAQLERGEISVEDAMKSLDELR